MMKWSQIELVRATTTTFVHGFQNNLIHLSISAPLRSSTIIAYSLPLVSSYVSAVRPCAVRCPWTFFGSVFSVWVHFSATVKTRLMILGKYLLLDDAICDEPSVSDSDLHFSDQ